MTDDDHDGERDPLLVRPYLRGGADAGDGDASVQTWPSATTREVRSQRALEGADDPTALLFLPEEPGRLARPRRRRALVLIVAGALAVVGAGAVGVAQLRVQGRPAASSTLPEAPVPALSGLVPSLRPSVTASAVASEPVPRRANRRSATAAPAVTSGKPAPSTAAPSGSTVAGGGKPGAALAPETAAAGRTGAIRGQNGLCLDLDGGAAVEFNRVQVAGCNGGAAQKWTVGVDGTLRVRGMCALIVGDDTVHITACDGRTTAQWKVSGQVLISAANGKCLTDPSSGTKAATGVTVTACDGRANKRWSLP